MYKNDVFFPPPDVFQSSFYRQTPWRANTHLIVKRQSFIGLQKYRYTRGQAQRQTLHRVQQYQQKQIRPVAFQIRLGQPNRVPFLLVVFYGQRRRSSSTRVLVSSAFSRRRRHLSDFYFRTVCFPRYNNNNDDNIVLSTCPPRSEERKTTVIGDIYNCTSIASVVVKRLRFIMYST